MFKYVAAGLDQLDVLSFAGNMAKIKEAKLDTGVIRGTFDTGNAPKVLVLKSLSKGARSYADVKDDGKGKLP